MDAHTHTRSAAMPYLLCNKLREGLIKLVLKLLIREPGHGDNQSYLHSTLSVKLVTNIQYESINQRLTLGRNCYQLSQIIAIGDNI